jgi:hypothetical protein
LSNLASVIAAPGKQIHNVYGSLTIAKDVAGAAR